MQGDISAYLRQQMADTDIFCFQEAYENMKILGGNILKNYQEVSATKFVTEYDNFQQTIYVKQSIPIIASGTILADRENCGLGLYVEVQSDNSTIRICNFHGMSRPVDKSDNPNRILQSEELIKFYDGKASVIIGGDFNIFPTNKSEQMFEEHGYRDLIKDFNIQTTRNQYAWEMYPNSKQYYSDYVFMSPDLTLKEFTVVDNLVSDHLPLHVVVGD